MNFPPIHIYLLNQQFDHTSCSLFVRQKMYFCFFFGCSRVTSKGYKDGLQSETLADGNWLVKHTWFPCNLVIWSSPSMQCKQRSSRKKYQSLSRPAQHSSTHTTGGRPPWNGPPKTEEVITTWSATLFAAGHMFSKYFISIGKHKTFNNADVCASNGWTI
jgi:hypothetical protein